MTEQARQEHLAAWVRDQVDSRTEDDKTLSRAIMDASDPAQVAQLVFEYYGDNARADRTPRSALYLHMGLLTGAVFRSVGRTVSRETSQKSEKGSQK